MRILIILLLSSLIASCVTPQAEECNAHYARCLELKKQIINNGATSNQLDAIQQRAELGRLLQSYQEEGC